MVKWFKFQFATLLTMKNSIRQIKSYWYAMMIITMQWGHSADLIIKILDREHFSEKNFAAAAAELIMMLLVEMLNLDQTWEIYLLSRLKLETSKSNLQYRSISQLFPRKSFSSVKLLTLEFLWFWEIMKPHWLLSTPSELVSPAELLSCPQAISDHLKT